VMGKKTAIRPGMRGAIRRPRKDCQVNPATECPTAAALQAGIYPEQSARREKIWGLDKIEDKDPSWTSNASMPLATRWPT
ncbi:hypothetical protein, partial [Ideonella azotifigens]|uniref:hypothetical protein n=1 Tax=Ideonella azotifigens TaxID=513160 RepID=UPI001B860581